jgi:allantoin racemase
MRIMVLHQAPQQPGDVEPHRKVEAMLRGYASPGTEVDYLCPDDHEGAGLPAAIAQLPDAQRVNGQLPYVMSTPALVRKIVWAEQNGYDAVVVRNAFDPGVEAARLAVRIPVIGICRVTMHMAVTLADRIGVTVPFDGYVTWTRRLMDAYHVGRFVTDVRSLALPSIHGVDRSTLHDAAFDHCIRVMRGLVEETGAECLVPLGAAVVPSIVTPEELEAELGVPVLNTNAIGIRFAEMCVELGMTHSARTYPNVNLPYDAFMSPALAAIPQA